MTMVLREQGSPVDARSDAAGGRSAAPHHDIVEIRNLLRTRWRLFRNVTLTTIGFTIAVVFALPTSYSSTAVVMIEPRKNNVTDQSSVLSELPTDPASVQNQIQLLTSRDLASRVIDKLGLADDPEFAGPLAQVSLDPLHWLGLSAPPNPALDAERHYDGVVTAFLKHLSVDAVGLSTSISVTFSARDPEKAALIANTVVDTYIDTQAAMKFDVTQRTTSWLIARIRQLSQQVQLAEASVQRYKAENNLNDTPAGGSLVDQQLAAINTQLVEARANLAVKQAENARIASLLQTGHAADVSEIVSSPLIVQLREQQADTIREEAQLSSRYGARHPKLIAIESQKRDLDAKIEQEVSRIAGSVQNDMTVAGAQVHSLEQSLRQVESQAASDNMARVKLQALEANAASTRSMYESFVTRLRETQGQDVLQMADARAISHAPVPLSPSWPPRFLAIVASVPFGMLLGLMAILFAERLSGPVETERRSINPTVPQDPLRGVPVLAQIGGISSAGAANFMVDQPNSQFAQAMRALAQRVAPAGRGAAPKIVTVTSLDPRDGQTTIAVSLARAASQLGLRVLLVDGNFLAPGVATATALSAPQAGLLEVLSGKAKLSQALRKDPRSHALVLSLARAHADPRAVWASNAMQRLVAHLKQSCDLVLVDAAPMTLSRELPYVSRLSDALIVVAAWNGPSRATLSRALDHLDAIQAPPTGIVFTA